MTFTATNYVFNFEALILGCFTIVLCLMVQALVVMFVTLKCKPAIGRLVMKKKSILAQLVFFAGILTLLLSHLTQIYIWGQTLYFFDIINNLHQAMVFAGSTYTTVGFVTDPIGIQWQLLTVIMAATGLFCFGWSTAVMFILSQALFPSEN